MEVLKKKISTFQDEGDRVRITDNELLMEIFVCLVAIDGSDERILQIHRRKPYRHGILHR